MFILLATVVHLFLQQSYLPYPVKIITFQIGKETIIPGQSIKLDIFRKFKKTLHQKIFQVSLLRSQKVNFSLILTVGKTFTQSYNIFHRTPYCTLIFNTLRQVDSTQHLSPVRVGQRCLNQRTITVGRRITVRLVSSLTRLCLTATLHTTTNIFILSSNPIQFNWRPVSMVLIRQLCMHQN